ncbi:hypothetical protein NKI96_10810 [Mesorhizobium sp. M0292]|uniref:hypothetical protein n=1 Tax=Mesorhizobium sp. M0292 TaxID=2956929 RepID=UPI003337F66C
MAFRKLTFVGIDSSGEYPKPMPWHPQRTDDYAADCQLGRSYFQELFEFMQKEANTAFLSRVLSAQVAGGRWDAVEIGFSQAMSEKLLVA